MDLNDPQKTEYAPCYSLPKTLSKCQVKSFYFKPEGQCPCGHSTWYIDMFFVNKGEGIVKRNDRDYNKSDLFANNTFIPLTHYTNPVYGPIWNLSLES